LSLAETRDHHTIVKLIHRALRMKRLRSKVKLIGYFMVIYKNVLETRYAPGGNGYLACKAEFTQYIASASTHQGCAKEM